MAELAARSRLRHATAVTVNLTAALNGLPVEGKVRDIVLDQEVGTVSGGQITISVDALSGRTTVVRP